MPKLFEPETAKARKKAAAKAKQSARKERMKLKKAIRKERSALKRHGKGIC